MPGGVAGERLTAAPYADQQDFGLRVSAGNKALYRRLLGKFASSSAGFGEQFQKTRQDADATAAIRCAHSLKGSAANMGLKGV